MYTAAAQSNSLLSRRVSVRYITEYCCLYSSAVQQQSCVSSRKCVINHARRKNVFEGAGLDTGKIRVLTRVFVHWKQRWTARHTLPTYELIKTYRPTDDVPGIMLSLIHI